MALSPDIVDILERAVAVLDAPTLGVTASGRLSGLLAEIDQTILPRIFHFTDGGQDRGLAKVANGRIEGLDLTQSTPRHVTRIGKDDTRTRQEQLWATAHAMAALVLATDGLTLTIGVSPTDADPDDLAFSAAELADALGAMGMTQTDGSPRLSGILTILGDAPSVTGDPIDAGRFQRLTEALSDLQPDLHGLLGDEVLVHLAEGGDQVLAIDAQTAGARPVQVGELDRVLRLWRGQGEI